MTTLILTPTVATVSGWLLIAVVAVSVTAATVCFADIVGSHLRERARFDDEVAKALGSCRVVDVDGVPIRVQSDREMTDEDREHVATVIRAARRRIAEAGLNEVSE